MNNKIEASEVQKKLECPYCSKVITYTEIVKTICGVKNLDGLIEYNPKTEEIKHFCPQCQEELACCGDD